MPTIAALARARQHLDTLGCSDVTLVITGGLRVHTDFAKALALGAQLTGMASPYLAAAQESAEAVRSVIERTRQELRTAMFLTGSASLRQLIGNDNLIGGRV